MRAELLGGLVVLWCAACSSGHGPAGVEDVPATAAGTGGASAVTGATIPLGFGGVGLGAECDESRSVASDSEALLVRDPEILKHFSLERVLQQLIDTSTASITPTALLQRLFDTENTLASAAFADVMHCDDLRNEAFRVNPGAACARVEGRLARSQDLLRPEHPDSFVPVALVNRFDLTPRSASSCGEYRIVYAKLSGKTDPTDRVFLILEGGLQNPSAQLSACRPVAELWAGLPSEPSVDVRAKQLESLFFDGVVDLPPVIHAEHFGATGNCDYGGGCGQVRLGQGMQAPWEFRQFQLRASVTVSPGLWFAPVPNGGSISPELFNLGEDSGRTQGVFAVAGELETLVAPDAASIKVRGFPGDEAGVSALDGDAQPDFVQRFRANPDRAALEQGLGDSLAALDLSACPTDDSISVEAVLARAAVVSCAGCHAPERMLPPERKLGCGVVWPRSLGEAHIDEAGNLSEALTSVFLPHRARVLATYLRACDEAAIIANLQRSRPGPILK